MMVNTKISPPGRAELCGIIQKKNVMNAQDFQKAAWFDAKAYPFPPKWLQIDGHPMHYIDVGQGPTLLFVHGTPTWSFLYRAQIRALSSQYRCIAVDHIGFGMSAKPSDAPYTPEWHSRNLERLVEYLNIKDITLVVHDFGGPIGLSFASRRPELIQKIVLLNTWLWETASNPAAQKVDRIIRSSLGRLLYLRMNASPKLLLKQAFADKRKLTKAIHRHYTRVFPSKSTRYGLLRLAENLVGASEWFQSQWNQMDKLAEKPFLIVWAMADKFITPAYLQTWEGRLRNIHQTLRLENVGHFVQEEAADTLTAAIAAFCKV